MTRSKKEVNVIDNETQSIVNTEIVENVETVKQDEPKAKVNYNATELGNSLFKTVTDSNQQLRDKIIHVFKVVGKSKEGLTAVLNAYADNYLDKNIKKVRKSELNAVFNCFLSEHSDKLLEAIKDKQKNINVWVKEARALMGNTKPKEPKKELKESEVDAMQDKAKLLNNEQAERVLDTLSSRLNGQLAFMLIGSLIDKLLDDQATEPIFAQWAFGVQQSHIEVMNSLLKPKREAEQASKNVQTMTATMEEAPI